jgi:hypothetical protein
MAEGVFIASPPKERYVYATRGGKRVATLVEKAPNPSSTMPN